MCVTSSSTTIYGQCKGGRCPCGNAGELCCGNNFPAGGLCSTFELTCENGAGATAALCQPCGQKDGPCCDGRTCSEPGTRCVSDTPDNFGPYRCRA
jgi:hypothetical protein